MLSGFMFMMSIVCFREAKDEVSRPEQQELPSEAQDFLSLQEAEGLFWKDMVDVTPDMEQYSRDGAGVGTFTGEAYSLIFSPSYVLPIWSSSISNGHHIVSCIMTFKTSQCVCERKNPSLWISMSAKHSI